MTLHVKMVLAGTVCLAALAFLLWETGEPDHCATSCWGSWHDDDAPDPEPVSLVRAYDQGRTTIVPLVSSAFLLKRAA